MMHLLKFFPVLLLIIALYTNCENSEKAVCESTSDFDKQYCLEALVFFSKSEENRNLVVLRCLVKIEEAKKCKSKSPIKPANL